MNDNRLYIMKDFTYALAHRDYLIQGSEVHVDMYDDRMVIYSPQAPCQKDALSKQ